MRALSILTLALLTFSLIKANKNVKQEGSTKEAPFNNYNLTEIMSKCNESFRIEMSYLEALNLSGSLPDETDKTPMCFLRCMLENTKVVSEEGEFDVENMADFFAGVRHEKPDEDVVKMAIECSNRTETGQCERSYNYLKCLIEADIDKHREQ